MQWAYRWMEPTDVVPWFDAGLGPGDADVVDSLQQHGVQPAHLAVIIDGRSAIRLYREHQSVGQLVAALRASGNL